MGKQPPAAGAAGDSDLQEENAVPADISSENTGSERELDDARIAELLANPMFIRFARGRSGGLETVCREFEEMLALGGKASAPRMAAPIAAKIVPASSSATPDVALSERQRAIARTAGMSYREYYELFPNFPVPIIKIIKENKKMSNDIYTWSNDMVSARQKAF